MLVASGFAEKLRELREAAGLSQYALAKAASISKQAINRLESGDSEPTWETVRKLARALSIGVEKFDTADEPKAPPPPPVPAKKPTPKKPKR